MLRDGWVKRVDLRWGESIHYSRVWIVFGRWEVHWFGQSCCRWQRATCSERQAGDVTRFLVLSLYPNFSLHLTHDRSLIRISDNTVDFLQIPVGKRHRIKLSSVLRNLTLALIIIILLFFKVLLHLLSNQVFCTSQAGQVWYLSFTWWSWDPEKLNGLPKVAQLISDEIEILPRFPWQLAHMFENVILMTFMEV